MDDRLTIDALEELAVQLRHAADREPRRSARRRRARLSRPLALFATLALTGSAVGGTLLVTEGDPVPSAGRGDFTADQQPLPGSDRLAGAQVSDPEGGLPWGLRLTEGRTGSKCSTLGRIYDGQVGVQHGGTFRPLPDLGPQQCVTFTSNRPIGLHISRLPNDGHPRTAIYGIASSRVAAIDVHLPGTSVTLRPGTDGAFLTVARGYPPYKLDVRYKNGRTDHLDPRPGQTRLAHP